MFKIISLAVLGYLFYRLVVPKNVLDGPEIVEKKEVAAEDDYIDYEEVE